MIFSSLVSENFISDLIKNREKEKQAEEKARKASIKAIADERAKVANLVSSQIKKVNIPAKYKGKIKFAGDREKKIFINGESSFVEIIWYDQDIEDKDYRKLLNIFIESIKDILVKNKYDNKYKYWIDEGGIGVEAK